ncbi:MAG: ethyl tert-butyl ether degradation protein EthD [Actinobacteria bacterium]|nr:ethyl tert-butyl ether degradation protein EthD [Actinomycetota bacterium]
MLKLTFCMHRLPHLTREQFQNYWENKHPLSAPSNAVEVLGIRKYIQVFPLSEADNSSVKKVRNGSNEFDGVAEIWIDDLETFTTKWKTGEGKEAFESFLEDEKNFVDWERSICFLAEEKVVLGGR